MGAMRSGIRWLVFALVACSAAAAALSCSRAPQSALIVDPDPLDFGVQLWTENPEMAVKVTNRSDRVVTLQDPTFNCSCFVLTAPLQKSKLRPGETIDLRVVMRTEGKEAGPFHKTMTVVSDDPVRPRLDTPIVGDVVDFREIKPRQTAIGKVKSDGPAVERRITVRGGSGSSVAVKSAVPDDAKRLTVAVEKGPDGADLLVRTVPGAPKGAFSVLIRLVLDVRTGGRASHDYSELVWVTGEVE